jgi:hypothetical protein
LDKEQPKIWSGLGHAYAASGKSAEARKVISDVTAKAAKTTDSRLDTIHDDPRFSELPRPDHVVQGLCFVAHSEA